MRSKKLLRRRDVIKLVIPRHRHLFFQFLQTGKMGKKFSRYADRSRLAQNAIELAMNLGLVRSHPGRWQ